VLTAIARYQTEPSCAETQPLREKRRANPHRRRQLVAAGVMLSPFLLLLGGLLAWPVGWTIVLSLTNEQLTGPAALHHRFIGLGNFVQLLSSRHFSGSLLHSLIYLVGSAYLGQVVLGFALALLLRACTRRIQAVVGGIIVACWVVPEIISTFMWFALLGRGGVLAEFLHLFGVGYRPILVTRPMLALDIANAWRGVAFSMMLFTAALATIPAEMLEAAMLDGASALRRITHIVLPCIKETLLVAIVLVTLATLNDFTLIYGLTGGGPGNASQVLTTYLYQAGFTEYRIAYGAAVSVILLLIGMVLSVIYVRALRKA